MVRKYGDPRETWLENMGTQGRHLRDFHVPTILSGLA